MPDNCKGRLQAIIDALDKHDAEWAHRHPSKRPHIPETLRQAIDKARSATIEQRFVLTIELGNDAMQSPYDVQAVLRDLAARLLTQGPGYPSYEGLSTWQATEGSLTDENGNTVGEWKVSR